MPPTSKQSMPKFHMQSSLWEWGIGMDQEVWEPVHVLHLLPQKHSLPSRLPSAMCCQDVWISHAIVEIALAEKIGRILEEWRDH